jgi:hypothetical protein
VIAVARESAAGDRATRIAALNDGLRQSGIGGRTMMTAGIAALPPATRAEIVTTMRAYDDFEPDHDPYGEHDFGPVVVGDVHCFWKIDAYDVDLRGGSPDPTDPTVTCRVLTLMLAEEY